MDNTVKVAIITGIFGIATLFLTQTHFFEEQRPPAISDLIPTPSGPQFDGTNITWNAIASDPNKDTIYYQFELNGPSTETRYVVKQGWSEKSDWIWDSNDSDIGINYIRVSVKDKKQNEPSGNATIIKKYSIDDRKMAQGEIGYSKITKMIRGKTYTFSAYVARSDSLDAARTRITSGTDYGEAPVPVLANNTLINKDFWTGSDIFVSNVTIKHPEIRVDLNGGYAFDVSRLTNDTILIPIDRKSKNYGLWLWEVKPIEVGTHFLELTPYDVLSGEPIGGGSIRIEVTVAEETVNETAEAAYKAYEDANYTTAETAEATYKAYEDANYTTAETAEAAKEAAPGFESIFAITGLLALAYLGFGRKH